MSLESGGFFLLFGPGLQGLEVAEILVEVEKQGSSFGELLAIPEQDEWTYNDGKSATCVAFVVQIYKAAGLFGPLASSIQATEFTVSLLFKSAFFFFFELQLLGQRDLNDALVVINTLVY